MYVCMLVTGDSKVTEGSHHIWYTWYPWDTTILGPGGQRHVAALLSASMLVLVNKVTLCWDPLVAGMVTAIGKVICLSV